MENQIIKKQKSLKLNVILNVFKTAATMLFPLITFPYVSRVLLPEGIGKVNFASAVISYFSIIASLGIGTYGTREAAKVRDDKNALTKLVKELMTINVVSTLAAYVLFFISIFAIPKFYNYRILLLVTSITLLFTLSGLDWFFYAVEDYMYITLRSLAVKLLGIICIFIFIKTPDDYIKYALITVISTSGSNICNLLYSRKLVNYKLKVKLNLKKHLKPIFILFASCVSITIFSVLDTTMVGFLKNDTEVGYYSAAAKIVRMIRDIFPAITLVLSARISYYVEKREQLEIESITNKTFNFIFCFAFPMTVGLILVMKPLMLLFCGEKFLPAVSSGQIMSPLLIFSSISGYLGGSLLVPYGKDKEYFAVETGAAILDVILNFIFIPNFGSFGASLATVLTEGIMFIVFLCLSSFVLKNIHMTKPLIEYFISAVIMGCAIYWIKFIKTNVVLQLIIYIAGGAAVYALCLTIFRNKFFIDGITYVKNKLHIGGKQHVQ